MYCTNCGTEVHAQAVACPKCGTSLTGKGLNIDTSALQGFNASAFFANRAHLLAAVALVGCFLPWLKVNAYMMSQSLNGFGLSKAVDMAPSTILISSLLYLLPLSLAAFLAADFVPSIGKYKKMLPMVAAGLVVYAAIGLYQITHPEVPEMPQVTTGLQGMDSMIGGMMENARKQAADMMSIGWGFYLTATAALGTFLLSRKA